jgi:Helix-turn-helix domain of alkylmercury lyase
MTEPHACSDAEFISSFECFAAIPPLLRLLARGRPVDLTELAAESGLPTKDLERILRAQSGTEWDDEGHLVGVWPQPPTHLAPLPGRRSHHLHLVRHRHAVLHRDLGNRRRGRVDQSRDRPADPR